jgi:hypothetical protein
MEPIGVEAEGETQLTRPITEKGLRINILEVSENRGVPNILHNRSFGFIARFT